MTYKEMFEHGYSWFGMMPLSTDEARQLFNKGTDTVYRLYEDDTEGEVEDIKDIVWWGVYGVEDIKRCNILDVYQLNIISTYHDDNFNRDELYFQYEIISENNKEIITGWDSIEYQVWADSDEEVQELLCKNHIVENFYSIITKLNYEDLSDVIKRIYDCALQSETAMCCITNEEWDEEFNDEDYEMLVSDIMKYGLMEIDLRSNYRVITDFDLVCRINIKQRREPHNA